MSRYISPNNNLQLQRRGRCTPPREALEEWLESDDSVRGRYGHLLLEQKSDIDNGLIASLQPYFESAHGFALILLNAPICKFVLVNGPRRLAEVRAAIKTWVRGRRLIDDRR
jgi:hypothetical protein